MEPSLACASAPRFLRIGDRLKVLVTGGSGFVGLNIVEALLTRGDEVVVASDAALPAYARSVLERLPGKLTDVSADVADVGAVNALFAQHQPMAVVHAAVITAGELREFAAFDRVVDVNLKGTAHVLSAAAGHGVRRVVYISSGSAYGKALVETSTVTEDTPAQPDNLYSITKHASERVCARFCELRGLDVVCTRLGSVFGPWERNTGVRDSLSLPFQVFRHAAAGNEVILPRMEARRDWVYSRDVACGVLKLLDAKTLRHRLYNLSTGVDWKDFGPRWCESLKRTMPQIRFRIASESETPNVSLLGHRDRAMMSIERLSSETGFRPRAVSEDVGAELVTWLATHRRYYESPEKFPQ
jgi:UDP-glucose 4-epimerase